MQKVRKLIDLPQTVIDKLAIEAIQSGNKNFKNHVEKVLTQRVEKKLK